MNHQMFHWSIKTHVLVIHVLLISAITAVIIECCCKENFIIQITRFLCSFLLLIHVPGRCLFDVTNLRLPEACKNECLVLFLIRGKYLCRFKKMKSEHCYSVYVKIQSIIPACVLQGSCLSSVFRVWPNFLCNRNFNSTRTSNQVNYKDAEQLTVV